MEAPTPLIALVDCNNFYVSCERVFRPDLIGKPVAVLSNNDGCIVARSQEVKNLGIKMATPVYQVQHLIKRHQVQLFSSNYSLYADMSFRVMRCLEKFTPQLEVYSIDESFLDVPAINLTDLNHYGLQIRKTVFRHTGIPVCVGIAPSKTLAKLANHAAKKWKKTEGVVDLSDPVRRNKLLSLVAVNEVWGIGRQNSKRLQNMGIHSAFDLAAQNPEQIQSQFNIVVARTVLELNGIPCLTVSDIIPAKQQIICSRSFKYRLTDYEQLAQALASFCSRAAEKLRHQQSVTASITVFIRTNPYNLQEPQYHRSAHTSLHHATDDSRQIISIAKQLLAEIYKTGYRYQKCGVQLGHIRPAENPRQIDLFDLDKQDTHDKSKQLMAAIDAINQRFPKAVHFSAIAVNNNWQTSVQYLSQRYTTHWDELAVVKCL